MGKKPNLQEICSKFTSIPKGKIPNNEKIVIDSLIAETVRLALNVDTSQTIRPIHILYLRNWVIKKLRSIVPNISDLFTMIFIDDTYNGPNPIFLGDIVELSNGFYIPGPTRLIKIEENSWILISGLPTSFFIKEGLEIEICGMSRLIKNISKQEINEMKIPIQGIDSYIGIDEINKSPEELIKTLINQEITHEWSPKSEWEIYIPGRYGKGGFGFSVFTGVKDMSIKMDGLALSFWRESREHQNTRYWLGIGNKLNYPKIDKKKVRGIEKFVTIEYEYNKMIKIPPSNYKSICLALDKISGNSRKAFLKASGDYFNLSMDFSPPGAIWRWFYSIGLKWNETPKHYIDLILPKVAKSNTIGILNRVGINTEIDLERE